MEQDVSDPVKSEDRGFYITNKWKTNELEQPTEEQKVPNFCYGLYLCMKSTQRTNKYK